MDARHFDALTRVISAPDSRRRLLALLATLPLLGGALGLFAPEDAAAKDRRRRRKQRHRRRKNPGGRKKGCKPKSTASVCAGRCGTVKTRQTCGKTVDCGSCDCSPACGACFTCQGTAGAPGTCVPQKAGTPCGVASCDSGTLQPQGSCDGNGVCVTAPPVSCAPDLCWDGACACGDVCASGCQFTSVQDAIDTLPAGSTVRICAGTFGAIYLYKDLTLIGVGDGADTASNTLLDGEGNGRVVYVSEGVTVSLEGIRITGGAEASGAAGVLSLGALTMTDCTVTDNTGSSVGAGMVSQGPSLTMTNCAVTSNTGQSYGGGIFSTSAVLTMTDCDISGNEVTGNAGGLHLEEGEATLTRCTVTGNTATGYAGGINNPTGHLTLDDSHVTNNMASSDGGVLIRDNLGATISILGDTTICGNDVPQCTGFTNSACQDTCS